MATKKLNFIPNTPSNVEVNANVESTFVTWDKTDISLPLNALTIAQTGGISWALGTSADDKPWRSVTYGNGLFVAVASSGTGGRVMTSADGITWALRTSIDTNAWRSVTYGNGLFVAVAASGTGDRVMTSADGITWESRVSASDSDWVSVVFGNGLFVAVAESITDTRVMTSPDGITWTLITSITNKGWSSVIHGNGLFVAVASSGTGDRVMTSADGITWALRTSASNNWSSIAYGSSLFVAVAASGTGDRVMTSVDGITWESRVSAYDSDWSSVTYGSGLFVSVAESVTDTRVMTSPDGITWTLRTSVGDKAWRSVTYGNGLFVAVASSGTGDRVMTSSGINTISLAIDASSDSADFTTINTNSSAVSTTDDAYNNLPFVFLSGRNIISRPKTITDYSTNLFKTSTFEYQVLTGDKIGLSGVANLIDDDSIYTNSTITYASTGSNSIVSYDSTTKTFSLLGNIDIEPSDSFTLNTAYYPRLYISSDNGETFDSGRNITFSVDAVDSPLSIEGTSLYNTFSTEFSDILEVDDPNFYLGYYVTFITGQNKGTSKQIKNFNRHSYTFTTDYFANEVVSSDIFSVNAFKIPRVHGLGNYVFKLLYWNNDGGTPIYSNPAIGYPSLSLLEYLTTLENNYWDTGVASNVYKSAQGVIPNSHGRAEADIKKQRLDFSIEQCRENKLQTNFGDLVSASKTADISYDRYRRRLFDIFQGNKLSSSYEGLYNLGRAFTSITPSTSFVATSGWVLSSNRLGYPKATTIITVASGDVTAPFNTFTTTSSGLSGDYTDKLLSIIDVPDNEQFDTSILGKLLTITSYTPGASATFVIDNISTRIPTGATIALYDSNISSDYGTRPYTDLSLLFGVRIYIYGPILSAIDTALLEYLISQNVPLHVRYFLSYKTSFYGESSLSNFDGTMTSLELDKSINALVPSADIKNTTPSQFRDYITGTVASVIDGNNTFTADDFTRHYGFYTGYYVTFTDGNNAGIRKQVLSYNGGSNTFTTEDFPYTIQTSDTFKIDTIEYQSKYVTDVIDLESTDFFSAIYTASWYTRKVDPDINENVYVQFSNNGSTFNKARSIYQNESLNTILSGSAVNSVSTTTFSGSGNTLSTIDDEYTNIYIKFTSGDNSGEIKQITNYVGSTKTFTTEAFTNTPQNGDIFVILVSDLARYCKMIIYHNYLHLPTDIEIESLTIKKL